MFSLTRPDVVTLLMALDATQMPRCKGAALVEVHGGTGVLRKKYGQSDANYRSHVHMTLRDTPILQAHVPCCSTSTSLLAAGYGIENTDCPELQRVSDAMNHDFAGMEDAVLRLTPLLGLLEDGLYAVADIELYPTDGEGRFFWDARNGLTELQATSIQYLPENYHYIHGSPSYLYPSQGTDRLDMERVRYYEERLRAPEVFPRAIAYHVSEYMSLLLDGHHKATAAFLLGMAVPCLVILPMDSIQYNNRREQVSLSFCRFSAPLDQLPRRISLEMKKYPFPRGERGRLPFAEQRLFTREWPAAYRKKAQWYPQVHEMAEALDLGIDDTANEAQLAAHLAQLDPENARRARVLLCFLSRRDGEAIKTLALRCAKADGYPKLRQAAFSVLSCLPHDWEIEQLFIEQLLEDHDPHSKLKQIADAYLEQTEA